jgi:hypothetical protein
MARVDLPENLRMALEPVLQELVDARAAGKNARGAARDAIVSRLQAIDEQIARALHALAPQEARDAARLEAESELAAYRTRLRGDAWHRALSINTDRLLRERYGVVSVFHQLG